MLTIQSFLNVLYFWVRLKKNLKASHLDSMLLGISKNGVIVLDPETGKAIPFRSPDNGAPLGDMMPLTSLEDWRYNKTAFTFECSKGLVNDKVSEKSDNADTKHFYFDDLSVRTEPSTFKNLGVNGCYVPTI